MEIKDCGLSLKKSGKFEQWILAKFQTFNTLKEFVSKLEYVIS